MREACGVRVKVEDILNLTSELEFEETVQGILNSTEARGAGVPGGRDVTYNQTGDMYGRASADTLPDGPVFPQGHVELPNGLDIPEKMFGPQESQQPEPTLTLNFDFDYAVQLNLLAQRDEPVFIYATSKPGAAELIETGVYDSQNGQKGNFSSFQKGGLHTTAYIPFKHRVMREVGHIPTGKPSDFEPLRKGRQGSYRKYVRIPNEDREYGSYRAEVTPEESFKAYPRLVALQVAPNHKMNIAVAPKSFFSQDYWNDFSHKLPLSCRGFDAFALPVLGKRAEALEKTRASNPVYTSCDNLYYMNGTALKDLVDGEECTALTPEAVKEAIYSNCLQEVKWNLLAPLGLGGDFQARLPNFLRVVFLASNNPDTPELDVVSFLGAGTKEEYEKQVCRAKAWSKGVFARSIAWRRC